MYSRISAYWSPPGSSEKTPTTQNYDTPAALTEELPESQQKPLDERDERSRESPTEPIASSSTSQALDHQPPRTPPKERGSEGRPTEDPIPLMHSRTTHATPRRDLPSPGPSRVVGFNPGENLDASGSALNTTNANPTGTRPNTATTVQSLLSSRPLSPDRRQTGLGLPTYDPIRGENVYLPGTGGNGEGDPVGVQRRLGNEDVIRRVSVPRPRSAYHPTDRTLVGNGLGSGSRRNSRLMYGDDWLPDVPVLEEPLPPVSRFFLPFYLLV